MARVHSITNLIRRGGSPPALTGPGTQFPIVFGMDEPGLWKAKLDVYASLLARTTKWDANYTMTHSYDYADETQTIAFSGSAAGNLPLTVFDPTQFEFLDLTEKAIAYGKQEYLIGTQPFNIATGVGSYAGTRTFVDLSPEQNNSGTYQVKFLANWYDLGAGRQPVCVGSTYYIPFFFFGDFGCERDVDEFDPPSNRQPSSERSAPEWVECGSLTITIPDWRFGGTVSHVIPLYYAPPVDGDDVFGFSVTLTPVETELCYGLDPSDPYPISTIDRTWNNDGTAARNPLG